MLITAFNEAKETLEKITGRPWLVIEHAAAADAFKEVQLSQRSIAFSSYGRRFERFHEQLLDFCAEKNLYYDYSNHDGKHPIAAPEQLYAQYCWHVNHSVFNICWPVEIANPGLAGNLHPVTCRWFEASSAGTIPLGKKPKNPLFEKYLFDNTVIEIDPEAEPAMIKGRLEMLWSKRETLLAAAAEVRKAHQLEMTWDNRVKRIINAIPRS